MWTRGACTTNNEEVEVVEDVAKQSQIPAPWLIEGLKQVGTTQEVHPQVVVLVDLEALITNVAQHPVCASVRWLPALPVVGRYPLRLRESLGIVKCLLMLRTKGLLPPDVLLKALFELLLQRDKELRKLIVQHVVSDVRRISRQVRGAQAVNRAVQNHIFSIMEQDDQIQTRCALWIAIDLYRRNLWCNERTVQVIANACLSKHTLIIRVALRFFLMQMPRTLEDASSDSDVDPGRTISKFKQKMKVKKKTKKRERALGRELRHEKTRYDSEAKEAKRILKLDADPVRMLRDPHQFAEQLLAKLTRTSERFEIRMLYLSVIARIVAEHEVQLLHLYSYLERYMEPTQIHATKLLAIASGCVHRMIPPETIQPLIRAIANHFINDRSNPDTITIGLNTIREMCARQPLAMNATLLSDLVEYRSQRGDRGVMMAARALLQLYRDVNPEILPAKLRGSKYGPAKIPNAPTTFGARPPLPNIPGIEALYETPVQPDEGGSDNLSDDTEEGSFVELDEGEELEKGEEAEEGEECDGEEAEEAEECDGEEAEEGEECEGEEAEECDGEEAEEGEECEDEEAEVGSRSDEQEPSGRITRENAHEQQNEEDDEPPALIGIDEPARGDDGWFVDAMAVKPPTTAVVMPDTAAPLGASRLLTDAELAFLRQTAADVLRHGGDKPRKGKKRQRVSADPQEAGPSSEAIEAYTIQKRDRDREARVEAMKELRKSKSAFAAARKKKTKRDATHLAHAKGGKLFQMVRRSRRVEAKSKRSVATRNRDRKANRKKDVKFRIKRGWKA